MPIPKVTLSPGLKERLAANMKNSVVVNLLGWPIGYTILCAKLRELWDLRGAKIVDMGGGYFLVQFSSDEAYQEAVLEGPWTLLGSYLQVQSWTTAFRIQRSSPLSTTVWIRILELPLHLYPLEVISAIGEAVGKVIRVDSNTSGMQRGKFARLAVTIDLTKPLVSELTIDGEEFKVEYENLQELCFQCGMYGHRCDACTQRPKNLEKENHEDGPLRTEKDAVEVYGPWMLVEKKSRQQGKKRGVSGGREGGDTWEGSRYNVLRDEDLEGTMEAEPITSRDTHVPMKWSSINLKKGNYKQSKQPNVETSSSSQGQSQNLRNLRPHKTTLGEFFDYTTKAMKEQYQLSPP